MWHQQSRAFHGVGVKRTGGFMRQNCFLVDGLGRLALEMEDGSGALPRTADLLRGERRKGNNLSQVGPRRHSRDGSTGRDRDRDRDQVGQGQKRS